MSRTTRTAPGLAMDFGYGDDVYRVKRIDGTLVVEHLEVSKRDDESRVTAHRFCCTETVTVTDEDRAGGDPDPDVNALTRANLAIERRHGR